MSKEDIKAQQSFLHFMLRRNIGVQNMHTIEIDYVNGDDVTSNIYNNRK